MKQRASRAGLSKPKPMTISFLWQRNTTNLLRCEQSNTGRENPTKAKKEEQALWDRHQKEVELY